MQNALYSNVELQSVSVRSSQTSILSQNSPSLISSVRSTSKSSQNFERLNNQSSMNNQLDIIEESIQGILDSFDQLPEVVTPKMEKKETIFPLKNIEKTRKTLEKPEKTPSKKFPENTSKCPTLFKSASTSSLDSSKNSSISSINHICLVANCSKCRNNSNRTSGLVSPNPNTPRNSNSFSLKGPMVFNSINYKNDLSKLRGGLSEVSYFR